MTFALASSDTVRGQIQATTMGVVDLIGKGRQMVMSKQNSRKTLGGVA